MCIRDRSFRVSDRQVYRYIDAAWERIKAVNEVELSEHKRRAVAAHYQMLREAKTVKEKATVWAALSRLLGLDAPKAVEVAGRNGGAIVIRHDPWLLYTSPSPPDPTRARMPASACKKKT